LRERKKKDIFVDAWSYKIESHALCRVFIVSTAEKVTVLKKNAVPQRHHQRLPRRR